MIKGLIGKHLSHSYSKIIHEQLEDYTYELIELMEDEVTPFINNKEFDALNVTIPYKNLVMSSIDHIDEQALKIDAVNTIVNRNGILYGYNTDYYGFLKTLEFHNINISNKKVIILGNGGASKAVIEVLKDLNAKDIILVKHNISNETITYQQAYKFHNDAEVIINCSPCGMYPNSAECPIDIDRFNNLESVVDLIYNPLQTKLLIKAKLKNLKYAGGLMMLIAQAILAISYFIDKEVDENKIIETYHKIYNDKKNIVLIGMPSCGKTTLATALNEKLNRQLIDIDEEITKEIKIPIAEYFKLYGEEAFRTIESKITENISDNTNCIISCGGGIILNEDNILNLMKNGEIYFIDRSLDLLVTSDSRPLSNDKNKLEKLYQYRYPLYQKYSDITIQNNQDIQNGIKELITNIEKRFM